MSTDIGAVMKNLVQAANGNKVRDALSKNRVEQNKLDGESAKTVDKQEKDKKALGVMKAENILNSTPITKNDPIGDNKLDALKRALIFDKK